VVYVFSETGLPSRHIAERNGMTVEKEAEWSGLPHLVYVGRRS
jgi:hypothetical protein